MAGAWKTLVYSPEARIYIEDVDVSRDLMRGTVSRVTGGASHLEFTLSNKNLRYNNRFKRMDRVVCYLSRLEPLQVFAGYLDLVPLLQTHPDFVTFKASCTIKRILYTYWDPGLPASKQLLQQFREPFGADASTTTANGGAPASSDNPDNLDAPAPDAESDGGSYFSDFLLPNLGDDPQRGAGGTTTTPPAGAQAAPDAAGGSATRPSDGNLVFSNRDAGLGQMLKEVLVNVGGWEPDMVKVQDFPESFVGYVEERMPEIENLYGDSLKRFKELFEYDSPIGPSGTSGTSGGGDLGEATFTTIGPPANGTNYNDDELVWIVSNAGWSGDDIAVGVAIIKAESSGKPGASNLNSNGTYDRGLWQINDVHNEKLPGQNRMDPAVSTQLARMIYQESGGWTPWSTYSYHGTYSTHLPAARAAAARGGTPPPGSGGTTGPGRTDERPKPKPSTPGTNDNPAPRDANAPDTSGMSIQDAIIAVVKYKFPGPPNPDQGLGNAGRFAVSSTSRSEPGSEHDFSANRAVDLAQGTQNSTPDMQGLAAWWKQNYMGKGILELIHDGPNNVYNDQDAGDGMSIYGASTMAQHRDHVHIAMSTVVSADGTSMPDVGGGVPGAGGAGGSYKNKLAQNIFTYMFEPSRFNDSMSQILTGRYASLNDQSLIHIVRALCESGLRTFQSGPSGEFLAFYPDYFGLDGNAPKLKLEDIETIRVNINANDDALVTHVFTRGANTLMGSMSSTPDLGFMSSAGVVTVEDEWLFDRATEGFYFEPEFKNAEEMLRRYGIRPLKKDYPEIWAQSHPEAMLLVAIKLFMEKWAKQFQTRVEFTFMPELFPGMRIEIVGYDLAVYVESVTHTFDYESGFATSASVMAPMRLSKQPRNDKPEGS